MKPLSLYTGNMDIVYYVIKAEFFVERHSFGLTLGFIIGVTLLTLYFVTK